MNSNPSLILSHDNLRNTTFDCDALGIHYEVSTEKHHLIVNGNNTKILRWDKRSNQSNLIAEWERHTFASDEFKFPSATGSTAVPVNKFLERRYKFTKKFVHPTFKFTPSPACLNV